MTGAGSGLDEFRGNAPRKAPNARTLAGTADNPGCNARRVLDAAGVDKGLIARQIGRPAPEGQSVFALQRGNRFERDVKDNAYGLLIALLRDEGFPVGPLRILPLRDLYPINPHQPELALAQRATETRQAITAMAGGLPDAYNLIDGAALEWDFGGAVARLETDGIAWRIGEHIHVIEVKSFPIVDGRADGEKLGSAARQAAVYVAAIQDLLNAAGLDRGLVSTTILLVCPRNTSLVPTLRKVNVARQVRALRRMLVGRTPIADLLAQLPPGLTLDTTGLNDEDAAAQLTAVIDTLGNNYLPSCLNNCPLAFHCRQQARAAGEPGCLGGDARSTLGSIRSLTRAVDLANGAPANPEESDAAALLSRASRLAAAAGLPPATPLSSRRPRRRAVS
jgi:hypothetical protein